MTHPPSPPHSHHASTSAKTTCAIPTTTNMGTLACPVAANCAVVPNCGSDTEGIVCGVLFCARRFAITPLGLSAVNISQVKQLFAHLLVALLHPLGACTNANAIMLSPTFDTSSNTSPAPVSIPSRPAASASQTSTDNSVGEWSSVATKRTEI